MRSATQGEVPFGGCFYFSADRHALTSRQAGYSIRAGLPAGPYGPLNGVATPRSTGRTLEQRDVGNYTDAFCPGLCDTDDGCEQKIARRA